MHKEAKSFCEEGCATHAVRYSDPGSRKNSQNLGNFSLAQPVVNTFLINRVNAPNSISNATLQFMYPSSPKAISRNQLHLGYTRTLLRVITGEVAFVLPTIQICPSIRHRPRSPNNNLASVSFPNITANNSGGPPT